MNTSKKATGREGERKRERGRERVILFLDNTVKIPLPPDRFAIFHLMLTMSLCQVQKHEIPVESSISATTATSPYSSIMAAANRMALDLNQERASRLAMEAVDLADAGQLEVG